MSKRRRGDTSLATKESGERLDHLTRLYEERAELMRDIMCTLPLDQAMSLSDSSPLMRLKGLDLDISLAEDDLEVMSPVAGAATPGSYFRHPGTWMLLVRLLAETAAVITSCEFKAGRLSSETMPYSQVRLTDNVGRAWELGCRIPPGQSTADWVLAVLGASYRQVSDPFFERKER